MDHRYLGSSGLLVSELCLGAMTFGRELNEQDSHKMLDAFWDAGGFFIDTADVYTAGKSEEIVGSWLKNKPRDEAVIATKVRFMISNRYNDVGLSRKHIYASVENSLKRLGTDYIDLYQLHCWDAGTPLEETLSTLDSLVQQGKVRYVGVSNYNAHQIQKAIDLSRAHRWISFVSLQPLYNLLDRAIEFEITTVCKNEGLGILPWSPLRGGWLSGKFTRGMQSPPSDTRIARASAEDWSEKWDNYDNERTWRILDALMEAAKELDKSPAQVAINWLKDRPGVTAPIIGARKYDQLKDNLGSVGWKLPDHIEQQLTKVSEMPLHYPYDFIDMGNITYPQNLRL